MKWTVEWKQIRHVKKRFEYSHTSSIYTDKRTQTKKLRGGLRVCGSTEWGQCKTIQVLYGRDSRWLNTLDHRFMLTTKEYHSRLRFDRQMLRYIERQQTIVIILIIGIFQPIHILPAVCDCTCQSDSVSFLYDTVISATFSPSLHALTMNCMCIFNQVTPICLKQSASLQAGRSVNSLFRSKTRGQFRTTNSSLSTCCRTLISDHYFRSHESKVQRRLEGRQQNI